jgi:hypothetical protein
VQAPARVSCFCKGRVLLLVREGCAGSGEPSKAPGGAWRRKAAAADGKSGLQEGLTGARPGSPPPTTATEWDCSPAAACHPHPAASFETPEGAQRMVAAKHAQVCQVHGERGFARCPARSYSSQLPNTSPTTHFPSRTKGTHTLHTSASTATLVADVHAPRRPG